MKIERMLSRKTRPRDWSPPQDYFCLCLCFCVLLLNVSVAISACPSISDFGAIGNDALADDDALQQALDTTNCLTIPPGEFLLNHGVTISTDGMRIIGSGPSTILKFTNASDPRAAAPFDDRPGMINILANDVLLRDFTLDQNFRGSGRNDGDLPIVNCITVGRASFPATYRDVSVTHLTFHDYYADAFAARRVTSNRIMVTECRFESSYIVQGWHTAGVGGEQAISIDRGENVVISGNEILGALDDAIATHLDVRNATISGNTITTTGGRILVNGGHNVSVTGNTIRYIQDGATAILVSREPHPDGTLGENIVIAGNTVIVEDGVTANGGLIYLLGPGKGVTVANNILSRKTPGGNGIRIADREIGDATFGGESILLTGNHIIASTIGIAVDLNTPVSVKAIAIHSNLINGADKGIKWRHPDPDSTIGVNLFVNTTHEIWPPTP